MKQWRPKNYYLVILVLKYSGNSKCEIISLSVLGIWPRILTYLHFTSGSAQLSYVLPNAASGVLVTGKVRSLVSCQYPQAHVEDTQRTRKRCGLQSSHERAAGSRNVTRLPQLSYSRRSTINRVWSVGKGTPATENPRSVREPPSGGKEAVRR